MANPNPSPETRFKAGVSGNPGGKTGEQLRIDREAADLAAQLRHKMLSTLAGKLEDGADPLDFLDTNALKLFKDSEDRAHGTPKATLAGDPDAPVAIGVIERTIVKADN